MTFALRFGPDGTKLIMSLAEDGRTDIYEMELATQTITQLTRSASIDTSPSYSPDGDYIVFNSDRGGSQLYTMRGDGTGVRRIALVMGVMPPCLVTARRYHCLYQNVSRGIFHWRYEYRWQWRALAGTRLSG